MNANGTTPQKLAMRETIIKQFKKSQEQHKTVTPPQSQFYETNPYFEVLLAKEEEEETKS